MAITLIDAHKIPRTSIPGSGEVAEILNNQLCGAKNVLARLHWLRPGEHLEASAEPNSHQLLYLMEGEANIILNATPDRVKKGGGVYLGPSESARIEHRGAELLKIFHLVVPRLPL